MAMTNENAGALAGMLLQLAPNFDRVLKGLQFMVQSPVLYSPYLLGTAQAGGTVVPAGTSNFPLPQTDFSHSLEFPFQIDRVRFVVDPSHTFRDARVIVQDLSYSETWMKSPVVLAGLIDANTGFWELRKPWILRAQGSGLQLYVDNLDANNPLSLYVELHGSLLKPAITSRG